MVRINYELPDSTHRRAKVAAAREGLTLKDFLIKALDEKADEGEKEKGS